ncbi:MAG: non-ribosomal peptide synthetase, partial [bacterium]|nr:non-ribosomal peptide synthetase [bacterium]
EKEYWKQQQETGITPLTRDFETETNLEKDIARQTFILNEKKTAQLLTEVNSAFNTENNDILLTALGLAIEETYGQTKIAVDLEGHGREQHYGNIDVGRTIGWFTSVYPVILEMTYKNDITRQIKEIKENLRKIPKKGTGYGIMKYLTHEKNKKEITFKLKPAISFNYLGQFDNQLEKTGITVAKENTGKIRSLKRQRRYDWDIVGIIAGGQLTVTISYNRHQYKKETMEKMAAHYEEQLKRIITYCARQQEEDITPSDLTYDKLSIDELDGIFDE